MPKIVRRLQANSKQNYVVKDKDELFLTHLFYQLQKLSLFNMFLYSLLTLYVL